MSETNRHLQDTSFIPAVSEPNMMEDQVSDVNDIIDGEVTSKNTKQKDETDDHETANKAEVERCPICMNGFNDPIVTRCNHKFCRECLATWVEKPFATCPFCRGGLHRAELQNLGILPVGRILPDNSLLSPPPGWLTDAQDLEEWETFMRMAIQSLPLDTGLLITMKRWPDDVQIYILEEGSAPRLSLMHHRLLNSFFSENNRHILEQQTTNIQQDTSRARGIVELEPPTSTAMNALSSNLRQDAERPVHSSTIFEGQQPIFTMITEEEYQRLIHSHSTQVHAVLERIVRRRASANLERAETRIRRLTQQISRLEQAARRAEAENRTQ